MSSRCCLAGSLALLLASTGCAQRLAPGVREVTVREYLFGVFGGSAIDLRDVCPAADASAFEVRRDASSYLISVATLGLYLPHQVRIQCRKPGPP